MDFIGPCTNVFSTAYAHVRTEPQSNIGQTRGKKKHQLTLHPNLKHGIERVERPGEAMKALDGKKDSANCI